MFRAVPALLAAAVATAALVGGGVVVAGDDEEPSRRPGSPTTAEATPLADLDTTRLVVARASFCNRVAESAVSAALGAEPETATAYGNGERTRLGRDRDIAHEFGCSWTTARAEARAWVFAPPVTSRQAAALVDSARSGPGCTPIPAAAEFGSPSLALACVGEARRQASYRGLFGDAWLACTLSQALATRRQDLLDRADLWCAEVVRAAAG